MSFWLLLRRSWPVMDKGGYSRSGTPDGASNLLQNSDRDDRHLQDYVASGYFLSRHAGVRDCTGIELRRVSLAHDHSQRRFFPESWTLSWCRELRERRIEEAAVFGIPAEDLEQVMAWADESFGSVFGAWNALFTLGDARAAARSFLRSAADLELWGVGLHRSLVSAFCQASAPPPQQPGHAPAGASAIHIATCMRPAPLAEGGTVLGHEILIADVGCSFNSPESLHIDKRERFREFGVVPNGHGLIDSLDEALACCRLIEPDPAQERTPSAGWLPWLIVRYPL